MPAPKKKPSDTDPHDDLERHIANCPTAVQQYVKALKDEILKLQRKIAKRHAELVSIKHQIKADAEQREHWSTEEGTNQVLDAMTEEEQAKLKEYDLLMKTVQKRVTDQQRRDSLLGGVQ